MAKPEPWQIAVKWGVTALSAVAALYLVFLIYQSGQPVWALLALGLFGLGFFIYLSNRRVRLPVSVPRSRGHGDLCCLSAAVHRADWIHQLFVDQSALV